MTALTPSTLQSKWWLHQRGGHRCQRSSTLSPFASRHTRGIIIDACQVRVHHECGALCWFVSVHFETHDSNRDVFWRQFRVEKTVENVSPRMQDCRVQSRRSSWQARRAGRQGSPSLRLGGPNLFASFGAPASCGRTQPLRAAPVPPSALRTAIVMECTYHQLLQ